MATVAEQLRTARTAHNLTVQQVAETLKIRSDHVRALEEGNYDVFTAPVYIKGFVRSYARLVKLDPAGIMATLGEELGQTSNFAEPPPLTDERRTALDVFMLQLSQFSWRKALVVLAAAALVGLGVWAVLAWGDRRANDPLKNIKPGLYQGAPGVGDVLPLPSTSPRR